MRKNNFEDQLIRKIEAGIRAIRLKTKTPDDVDIMVYLDRLKEFNEGMYQEYLVRYHKVLKTVPV